MGSPNNFREGCSGQNACGSPVGATDKDVAAPEVPALVYNPYNNPKLTVGEALDLQIKQAREAVEKCCVRKAKLEAMGWLDLPYSEVRQLLDGYSY